MLRDVNGQVIQVRSSGIGELLKVVFLQANDWARDFKYLVQKYENTSIPRENIAFDCPNWDSRWLISQTFTAMVLEAFYYDYIFEKESKNKAEKQCSPVRRYAYIAETYLGQSNVLQSEIYRKLDALNTVRRHWIHNKSAEKTSYKYPEEHFSPGQCLAMLNQVFSVFEDNDPSCTVARVSNDLVKQEQLKIQQIIRSI
ncbi:hypothetical protein [Vibrio furnissii]|uniref:hypothetical protein n=1 Tax=Vibrio furnissii TaxID=29494 RepID=UPI001EEA83E1|nr:hypothetical protein [Vibrio furnissii]MCG6231575.1 hypothetical protein [Vibrio furnissii]MCG6258765.1 hypothetical protein [Vibrio furnissii]